METTLDQKLKTLQRRFDENSHDIAVLDIEGAAALWYADRLAQGATMQAAQEEMRINLDSWGLSEYWERLRSFASLSASYYANVQDLRLLHRLARELSRGGSILTKYRIKESGGKTFVILKGNARSRELLRGTRYLVQNTKIVSLGIGRLGVAKSVAGGTTVTIWLSIAFRAIDTLLTEEATWHDFVGKAATDVVKTAVSGGAAYIMGAVAAGGAAVGSIAIGPLFLAVAVGLYVSWRLNEIDESTGATAALIAAIRQAETNLQRDVKRVGSQWRWLNQNGIAQVQFWMRVFGSRF